jgi:hypothetical protein
MEMPGEEQGCSVECLIRVVKQWGERLEHVAAPRL